ncbi:MAG: AAA family ATPase [Thiotrichales bacterium]|nr:AAA family ATPase [Thiotrichales bacterium]
MKHVQTFAQTIIDNVERVIVGQREALELTLVALLCEGHVLLEDVPGVGKTMMARSLGKSLGAEFKRIQCTPDLLPSDITGVSVFDQRSEQFEFLPGPVFSHVLLVDEINRATPRAQSALLEAMAERQVSVDGASHSLPRPFLVLATQNPIEYEGTFALPEAQLDRFFIKLSLGYPTPEDEATMLERLAGAHPIESLNAVADAGTLPELARQIWEVHVDQTVRDYLLRLVTATREHADLALGVSPRGGHALFRAAQGFAALQGRDHALPDDIKHMAVPVLEHRCILKPESALRGNSTERILTRLLDSTPLDIGEH